MIRIMPLRIGHLSTFYHTAILLMSSPDFEEKLGSKVQWKLFGTGPAIVDAFEGGELDLAYIGLPPAIIGMARGVPIKCIAGGHMEGTVISGGIHDRAFPQSRDLEDILKQYKGKKIGVPGTGSIHDVILSNCLEQYGLRDSIEIINFRWADMVTEAFVKGEIACAFGTPSLAVSIRHFAGGETIYPPYLLWPNNPSYGIITASSFLDGNPALAERFLELHEEATVYIRKHTQDASRRISEFVGIVDEYFVMQTLALSPKYCAQLPGMYIQATMEFAETLRRLGYIDRDLDRSDVFDDSLITRVHGPGDHYRNGINLCRISPLVKL